MNREKTLGLVAGALLGDALGAPFKNVKGGHIQQLAGDWVDDFLADPNVFPDKPDKIVLPGLHTGHGQEFLAVLAGMVDDQSGQHPVARTAANLRDLADTVEANHQNVGALRQPGRPLRKALERWAEQFPWDPADHFATDEASEGASVCMRGLAAAISGDADPIAYARLTHLREAPLVAAWTIWRAAQLLAENRDAEELLEELIAGARVIEDELREGEVGEQWREIGFGTPIVRFSECLSPIASLLRTGDDALAEKTLLNQAKEFVPDRGVAHVQHGFAPILVPWVLYRALGPMSPINAIEDAVNRGGETPLAAALIGGLMGARHGIDQIPDDMLAKTLGWRDAEALALSPSPDTEEAWLADERKWTGKEEALREPIRAEFRKRQTDAPPKKKKKPQPEIDQAAREQGKLPFAPPPEVWLREAGDELAPWEKQRLKSERGRKRIGWKEDRRERQRHKGEDEPDE
ncbi:ADP-ribosylglycohydrolase family protein [bacterium]|nr:ADP-ribosylglycohydrolase family protein [bacterium]